MKFGPAIPHNPHGYTAKDGTYYPAVFPYGGDTPVMVMTTRGRPLGFTSAWPAKCVDWSDVLMYRLPADHHVYGPKVSRMGREPDRVFNVYEHRQDRLNIFEYFDRATAHASAMLNRIGIWRVYLKAQPE